MISARQVEKVEEQVADAVALGAQVVAGGRGGGGPGSNFFEPTVVIGANHRMRLMAEETFGPVIAIEAVASSDEAIERANASAYGLSATVWTAIEARPQDRLAAGGRGGDGERRGELLWHQRGSHGGQRASGWGRSHSRLGVMETVQVKYVDVDRLPGLAKPWWFGYGESLANAADRYVQFAFAPSPTKKAASAAGKDSALKTIFRGNRI